MSPPDQSRPDATAIARAAAAWVLRLDRGLTTAEQDDYTQWLAADPRHRAALAEARWGWDELDRLAGIQDSVHAVPDPDLLRRPRRRAHLQRFWVPVMGLAAAAAGAVVLWWPRSAPVAPATPPVARTPSYALAAPIEERTLEDGTTVALNRGAMLDVDYSQTERRVHLICGEASFIVSHNPLRPFVVQASGVDVRAVGTAFNVRLDGRAVEVLVTEGKVKVSPPATVEAVLAIAPLVEAGQRTVVSLDPAAPSPQVTTLSKAEQARALAWQPRLLDFTNEPLSAIVAEFNRRNPVRLVVADPTLGALHLSASFRSDNVEGFVHLMETEFGMRAEWRGETEIALRPR